MHTQMDIDRFWQIVESSRSGVDPDQADGNMEIQLRLLRRLLLALPSEEIVGFRDRLLEQYGRRVSLGPVGSCVSHRGWLFG